MKTRTVLKLMVVLAMLLIPSIAIAQENFKYPVGTVFRMSDGTVFMVSGYQGNSYEITSTAGSTYMDRATVDAWTPTVLETTFEWITRKISTAAVIGGVIKPELYGDMNGDNVFTKPDAVILTAAVAGTETLNTYQQIAGDVNNDGVVDKKDAIILVVYYFSIANGGVPNTSGSRIGQPIPNALETASPPPVPVTTTTVAGYTVTPSGYTPAPVVTTTAVASTPNPAATVSFYSNTFQTNGLMAAGQTKVLRNSQVDVFTTITSTGYTSGTLAVEVRRDFYSPSGWTNDLFTTFTKTISLQPNQNTVYAGTFTASDLTGVSNFVQYYVRISWEGRYIYDREDIVTRGSVTTYAAAQTSASNPQSAATPVPTLTPTQTSTSGSGGSGTVSTPTATPSSTPAPTSVLPFQPVQNTQPAQTGTVQATPAATVKYDCNKGFDVVYDSQGKPSCIKASPGFEALIAIAGLLVVAFIVLRKKKTE